MIMFPGPVSKGDHLLGLAARRDGRHVGDAADVQRDPAAAAVAKEQVIDVGHERRALAARRHIRGTEVRHDRRSRQFGNQRRLADLQRAHDKLSADLAFDRLVIDSLAV